MNHHIVLYFCLLLNTNVFGKIQRIVGGENIHIRQIPYQVSLRFESTKALIGGGAIISEWYILTAAHCLYNKQISDIKVYAGSNTITGNRQGISIQYVHIHPGYTGKMRSDQSYINDIAVILLAEALQFNKFQNKVKLPSRPTVTGDQGIISGWGLKSYPSDSLSPTLQRALMQIQDNGLCSQILNIVIHDKQMCAFHRQGIGACTGDSGGPLVCNGEVIGVASFVLPCATGVPDVYTRVYSHLDFIQEVTGIY